MTQQQTPGVWTLEGCGEGNTPMIGGPYLAEEEAIGVVEAEPVAELLERWKCEGRGRYTDDVGEQLDSDTDALLRTLRGSP